MLFQQKIAALIISILVFLFILELVRRRRLREEYAWLWLCVGAGMIVLTVWYDLLVIVTHLIGAALPTTTLFLFGLVFLVLVCAQFSTRLSDMTTRVKNLAQEVALLKAELEEKSDKKQSGKPD